MRRYILAGFLLLTASTSCLGEDRPIVGAIRWDAWTGGGITEQVERTLGPKRYHNRVPWFGKVVNDSTVKIDGSPQEVMDREIGLAASAGLDYWAFLIYPKNSSMSTALNQYLKSRKRTKISFCMILANTLLAGSDKWPEELDRAVTLLSEPGYQTVLDDRPLVYTFTHNDVAIKRFNEFLTAARKKGLAPYCVYMGWNPAADYKKVKAKGFDAVSAYAFGGNQARFSDLVKSVEKYYWQNAADAEVPYVPLVTTGWDKNPRKDNPVTWEKGHGYHRQKVFPSRAQPSEIATHLSNALEFVGKHSDLCQAQAVIIYAWNEYDEGGWLAPTRNADETSDNSRLDAIRKALKREKVTQ